MLKRDIMKLSVHKRFQKAPKGFSILPVAQRQLHIFLPRDPVAKEAIIRYCGIVGTPSKVIPEIHHRAMLAEYEASLKLHDSLLERAKLNARLDLLK